MVDVIQVVGAEKAVEKFTPSSDDVVIQAEDSLNANDNHIVLGLRSAELINQEDIEAATAAARCSAYFRVPCCSGSTVVKVYFGACGWWRFDYVCNHRCAHTVYLRCC